ncbi:hypothetical protein Dform_01983 [Dehalogenimonas formicexedens]|uniref:Uncharacterized protein n=2 Tax=Dehalogenimonas TaxID=670486 RepID=A0A1P8FA20_9CHLR|nr:MULTISPECIES: hypothetical protein [Dehalogenimonas]APV45297.1 hypothetical protein Dform_01983 [Dehalogenimonas formicexedens]KTB49102.1 hypothetical protein DEALK_00130 [Dehalogenimonas alkenigignens]
MAKELAHCFVKIPVKPLDDAALDKVRALERKLGVQLIAFSAMNEEYAKLSQDQLKEVEGLGKDIDAAVVAYNVKKSQARPRAC